MSGRNTTMTCPLNLRKEFHLFTFIRDIERQFGFPGEGAKRRLWQVCLRPPPPPATPGGEGTGGVQVAISQFLIF